MRTAAFWVVLLGSLLPTATLADVPGLMNYQGTLTDAVGVALDTTVSMTFSIYPHSEDGTAVWTETQPTVVVSSGIFSVLLGSVSSIPDTVFRSPECWLGLQVGGDDKIKPRQRIVAVGYAFRAAEADTAEYARSAPSASDGDWAISGIDMYSAVSGDVGIGTASPTAKLHVVHGEDYAYLVGDIYGVYGSSGDGIGVCGSSNSGEGVCGHSTLHIGVTGHGSLCGVYGSHLGSGNKGYLGNSNSGVYGYSDSSYGVYGLSSDGYGVYGYHPNNNYGYLGGDFYGVYGQNTYLEGSTYGYIAGDLYGVCGENSLYGTQGILAGMEGVYGYSVGSYGVYGSSSDGYGVYGSRLGSSNEGYLGSSKFGVYGYSEAESCGTVGAFGYHTGPYPGNDYLYTSTHCGVVGRSYYGCQYHCGVQGVTEDYFTRTSGVHGRFHQYIDYWGALAYKASGMALYGGYFTSYTTGSGRGSLGSEAQTAVGLGSWGDLFGADIHGKIYGTYTEGGNYALYSNGNVFTNGMDVHLQDTESSSMTVLYTNVSTDVTVQTSGFASLAGGKSSITFDEDFTKAVSTEVPIVVTVTPAGPCEGVYVAQVTKDGFTVVENSPGESNITVAFIAIGRRAGYENPQLPAEVISSDYVDKLSRGLHNDADTDTDGQGLYFEDGQLYVGVHPSTLPNPHKPLKELEQTEKHRKLLEVQERERLERERIGAEARRVEEERQKRVETEKRAGPLKIAPNWENMTNTIKGSVESK